MAGRENRRGTRRRGGSRSREPTRFPIATAAPRGRWRTARGPTPNRSPPPSIRSAVQMHRSEKQHAEPDEPEEIHAESTVGCDRQEPVGSEEDGDLDQISMSAPWGSSGRLHAVAKPGHEEEHNGGEAADEVSDVDRIGRPARRAGSLSVATWLMTIIAAAIPRSASSSGQWRRSGAVLMRERVTTPRPSTGPCRWSRGPRGAGGRGGCPCTARIPRGDRP